jgi:outer membrane receptor protein involved in Fe transport
VTDRVETSPGVFTDITRQDGDQLVRGWEADVSWVLTDSVTIGSSFGRVDSKYTNFGVAFPEALGRSVANISPENGSAYVKYSPTGGMLKGLYFNGLVTYVSSTPTQSPVAGDTTVTSTVNGVTSTFVTAHTDAWKLRLPSYTLWEFGVHYRLPRLGAHWDQEISFNLKNAFDKYYLKTSANAGDRRGVLIQYTLTHGGSH